MAAQLAFPLTNQFQHVTDVFLIEELTYCRVRSEQAFLHEGTHPCSKPVFYWVRKSFFLPVNNILRQPFLKRLFMEIFSSQTFQFQAWRKTLDEFDQPVIQEWNTSFKRVCH